MTTESEVARSGTDGFKGLKERYEDRVAEVFLTGLGHMYGMFDGHGGAAAAEFAAAEIGSHIEAAVRNQVPDFDKQLQTRRDTVKRLRVESEREKFPLAPLSESAIAELTAIEGCAVEVDGTLAELKKLSYAPPLELVEMREALVVRKQWLDKASRKRKGGRDSSRALAAAVAEREELESRAITAGERAESRATLRLTDDLWRLSLERAFKVADDHFLELAAKKNLDDGTTACLVILPTPEEDEEEHRRKIVMANCGDSRAILCRGRRGLRLSTDHKPANPPEKRRIEKLGGYVVEVSGVWRVTSAAGCGFGVRRDKSLYLSVARALGDRQLKQPTPIVSSEPEVKLTSLDPLTDFFLVLVCDGITDVLDDNAVVAIAAKHFGDPAESARQIVRGAFTKGAADNVTALVVEFPWTKAADVAKVFAEKEQKDVLPAKPPADAEPFDMFA